MQVMKKQLHYQASKKVNPKVFASIFTLNSDDYEKFRDALSKLVLNDSSLIYEPEVSDALGFGFRCGIFRYFTYGSG